MKKSLVLILLLLFLIGCGKINSPEKISKRQFEAKILKCEYERSNNDDTFLYNILEKAKEKGDVKLIKRVLIALGRIRKPEYINWIIPYLHFKNYKIRAQAIFSLGEILKKSNREIFLFKLNKKILNSIRSVSKDSSIYVRSNLIEALGKIGDDCGVNLKKFFIFKKSFSEDELYYIHQLLKTSFRLKKVEFIPLIKKYLKVKNNKIVIDALFTLRILARYDKNEKISIDKILVEKFFNSKNKYVLPNFIRLLPYLNFSKEYKFQILKRSLKSDNFEARIEAIRIIGKERNGNLNRLLVNHFKKVFDSFSAFPTSTVRKNLNEIKEILKSLKGYNDSNWKKIILNLYNLYPYFRVYLAISYLSSFSENREYILKRCDYFPTEDHYLSWVKFLSSTDDKRLNTLAYKLFMGLTGYNIDVNWILSGRVLIAESLLKKGILNPLEILDNKYSPLRELALYKISEMGEKYILKNKDEIVSKFSKYLTSDSIGDKLAFVEISKNLGENGKPILYNFLKNKNYIVRLKSAWALKKFFAEDSYSVAFSYNYNLSDDYFYRVALYEELPIIVNIKTTCGIFQVRLYPKDAPFSVENFISLISSRYYDRNVFHRVIPDFVVQWGSLRGCGYFDSGYSLPSEFSSDLYGAFSLGKANSGMDTSSSQLFITLSPQPHLEGYYTLLGKVIGGRAVLEKITQNDTILNIKIDYPFFPNSIDVVY